jgi:hypothetical protein
MLLASGCGLDSEEGRFRVGAAVDRCGGGTKSSVSRSGERRRLAMRAWVDCPPSGSGSCQSGQAGVER